MRCLVLMEAPAARILNLVLGHPRLRRMVEGNWMRLGRIDPDTDAIEIYERGAFQPWREAWPEFGRLAADARGLGGGGSCVHRDDGETGDEET
jgi:hypothetical protein